MEEQAIFKKRFRGFDKSQVLSYIDSKTADYHKKIGEKEAENAALLKQLADKVGEMQKMAEGRDLAVHNYEKLLEEHENTLDAAKKLGEEYSRLKQDAEEKRTRLREAESRLAVFESDRIKNEYTKKQIADAYIAARKEAKEIIERAKLQADLRGEEALKEQEQLGLRAAELKSEISLLREKMLVSLREIEIQVELFAGKFPAPVIRAEKPAESIEEREEEPQERQPAEEMKRPTVRVSARPAKHRFSDKVQDAFKKWL